MPELREGSRTEKHALPNCFRFEISISADFDGHQLVPPAGRDEIVEVGLVVDDALLFELDISLEVALILKVIA